MPDFILKNTVYFLFLVFHFQPVTAQTDTTILPSTGKLRKEGLNMLAAGYHIGGLVNLGTEYEYRFSKHIGLNAGAGISGFTAGIRLHTCPCTTGPFFNFSFKDGGFGKIGTINLEAGGVLFFLNRKNSLGLMAQTGIGRVIYLSESYRELNNKELRVSSMILSAGVGICWYYQQK